MDDHGLCRDRAIGLFTSIFPIGGTIGPVLGGIFLTYWSWRGIFLVNVPIGVVLLLLTLRFIRGGDRKASSAPVDLTGKALVSVTMLAGMLAITYLGEVGARATSPKLLVPLAVAVVAGVLVVRHVRRAAAPFIPVRLLHGNGFGALAVMAWDPHVTTPFVWLAIMAGLTGVGMGIATPASNNASLEVAPDQVAAISGLRAMFRQSGAIASVSVTTAILSRSVDPGIAQAWIYVAYGLVLLATVALVRKVPERHGSW